MNKIVGFYDTFLFDEKRMNDNNGILISDKNKNLIKISYDELKRNKKCEVLND